MSRYCYLPVFFLLLLPLLSPAQKAAYELVKREGIWVEQFDSTQTDKNRYTADNHIFKEGYRFVYRYHYLDKEGNKYLQRILPAGYTNREENWKLVPLKKKDSLTNDLIKITVVEGLEGLSPQYAAYHQTPIRFEYYAPAGQLYFTALTGVIENEKNVWMHPPRERLFRILELNPLPYIAAPFVAGHQWQWELQIGEQWGDPRWASWKGNITNRYHYTIKGKETLQTPLGSLSCWVVEAEAKSRLGTTGLIAYFHPDWGFVRLDYTNIDGSQLQLELLRRETANAYTKPFVK